MSGGAAATEGVAVCCQCGWSVDLSELCSTARRGRLEQVCRGCFHLRELQKLLPELPASDPVRETAEDGLQSLYQLVKQRVEERLAASSSPSRR